MNGVSGVQNYFLPQKFDRALKAIREAIIEMELDILGEFQFVDGASGGSSRGAFEPKVLLVSCPILELEAMALGRAAAAFLPLHVLVSAEEDQTRVLVIDPAGLFDGRLPVGASGPVDRLVGRVEMAMESLSRRRAAAPAE